MISFILVCIGAICNALMDTVENEVHFNMSVLRDLNRRFWLKSISWEFAKKFFGWKADAWHISKSLMLWCLLGVPIFHEVIFHPVIDFVILGNVWNFVFVNYYKRVFRR